MANRLELSRLVLLKVYPTHWNSSCRSQVESFLLVEDSSRCGCIGHGWDKKGISLKSLEAVGKFFLYKITSDRIN